MAVAEQVHWHEGLFLQPHHLQAMQRRLADQIAEAQTLFVPYAYGVVFARLAPDAVQKGQVRFERLRVVMRSGLTVDVPGNADLPPLELAECKAFDNTTEPLMISIGVPQWYPSRANSVESGAPGQDGRAKRLYKVTEVKSVDENTGQNPQPLLVRRINARLLVEGDDVTDLEVLPLFRVANPAAGTVGLPVMDEHYFPPCLVVSAWAPLLELLKDLVDKVHATRGKVARELTRDGFQVDSIRPAQLPHLLRLQALNRFSGRLPAIVSAQRSTPFQVYLELRDALGELAALKPDYDLQEVPEYDHDNPALAFKDLAERLRAIMEFVQPDRFTPYPMAKENRAFVARNIAPEHLDLPAYYLGIRTSEDRSKVATLVEKSIHFKMLPASLINKAAQRGIRLALDHNPPSNLPSDAGTSYFRMMRNDDMSEKWWQDVTKERAVGVTWLGLELPDAVITLYGMVGA
jgi:type VI secretion system protein ImpJ